MKMGKITIKTGQELTLQESHNFFIRKCEVKNLAERTIGIYTEHFQMFQKFINDNEYGISDISLRLVEDFTFHLMESKKRNNITVNMILRSIRAFLYFCMDERYIPIFKIKMLKVDKEIKETYTDTELGTLLKKPNLKASDFSEYKIWAFSNYLLGTGNRISSALNIKITDLDFDNAVIRVNKAKNRKAQIIPLSHALSTVLREYLTYRKGESTDFLFCNAYGDKPDIRTYQGMLASYNKRRGVVKTSAHLYRHTFAKKWILNGGDIFRLQKILGHSDLSVVKEYVNMFGGDLAVDFDRFNPLDSLEFRHTKEK